MVSMLILGLLGLLAGLVVLAVIVGLIVWAVRSSSTGSRERAPERTAREILDARYARGEITREQYQEMLKDMT